jgi:hypothetical protein
VSRNSDDDSHSESAASCIQRSFRRRSFLAHSNRSLLEGGDASTSSLGGATAVAVGVGATTVVALDAGTVARNHVSFNFSTDLNEVGTESMDNDLEANDCPTDASDNDDEMGLEYLMADSLGDDVPEATETEYTEESYDLEALLSAGNEDLMVDNLVKKKSLEDSESSSSNSFHSESELPGQLKRIGWGAVKGAVALIGLTMVRGAMSGGPVDEDDLAMSSSFFMPGGGFGGGGGTGGAAGTGTTQGASTAQ